MELGINAFGDAAPHPLSGERRSEAEAIRNVVEAIELADQVGLAWFGIGEHHTPEFPGSAATPMLAAAAMRTSRIKLSSAVTVLGTDDPVRVYQHFSTVDALSHGRAEIIAGRGSSIESFPLFGYALTDYDRLFAEKLELLKTIIENDTVEWSGTVRPPLDNLYVPPRAESGTIPLWLGVGGNPGSAVRAARLGLPVSFGVLGGSSTRGSQLADLYREAAAQNGNAPEQTVVMLGTPGFISENDRDAKDRFWPHWNQFMTIVGKQRGFRPPERGSYDADTSTGGGLLVGSPEAIAERIIDMHAAWGHARQFIHMDVGGLSQRDFLHAIELFGTRVRPIVEAELGDTSVDAMLGRSPVLPSSLTT